MSWGEALRLVEHLAADPSTALAASLNEWAYPFSREAMAVADLYDLQHTSKAKRKPQPYPRPWSQKERRRIGSARLTTEQLRAVLDAHQNAEVTSDE